MPKATPLWVVKTSSLDGRVDFSAPAAKFLDNVPFGCRGANKSGRGLCDQKWNNGGIRPFGIVVGGLA
jgi:hypothetical protein